VTTPRQSAPRSRPADAPELRLSVWQTAQRDARTQRRGRYLPESTAHPAKMLPAIAATAITRYTEPGDLVADPMCGIGTTLVEAVHLGRDALGIEYEQRWADLAAANAAHARRHGATGTAQVIRGDARQLPRLLPPGTAGRAALVVTSPPYGPSVHGQVRAEQRHGQAGGSASTTTGTATTRPTSPARAWTSSSPDSPPSWPAARCCCARAGWPW
jgi:modification methylase